MVMRTSKVSEQRQEYSKYHITVCHYYCELQPAEVFPQSDSFVISVSYLRSQL